MDNHSTLVGGSGHVFDTMALEISQLLSKVCVKPLDPGADLEGVLWVLKNPPRMLVAWEGSCEPWDSLLQLIVLGAPR